MLANTDDVKKTTPGIGYLFYSFCKIGAVSFGGHMALVAMVQKIMADKDKQVDHETIMEGVGLAGLLPGPLAVNVVAHIGYRAKGWLGAAVSVVGVLLPAFVAMVLLSWLYVSYGVKHNFPDLLRHITGTVCAIILAAGIKLFIKEIVGAKPVNYILCIITAALLFFVKSYWATFGMILAGALIGGWGAPASALPAEKATSPKAPMWKVWITLLLLAVVVVQFLGDAQRFAGNIVVRMASVFSGISLTLFGGGYVAIPLMQQMLVEHLHWLSLKEFVDGIAFSQATPGPILVSATFFGFKLSGIIGSIVGTISIFLPSILLMLCMSKILLQYRDHSVLKRIMAGIKPVVIGLILATAIKLPFQAGSASDIILWVIAALSFVLIYRFRVNPGLVVLGTILTDFLIYSLNSGL